MQLWNVTPERAALFELAARLGADVPICLDGRASFVGGIGEEIAPVPALPAGALLLVNPLVETPTPAIFKARQGAFSSPARWSSAPRDAAALADLLSARKNDLAEPATRLAPVVADVLAAIDVTENRLLARMSGSGATCFGLFANLADAEAAHDQIKAQHPAWWAVAAEIAR
jgi:4-diphosphocytidyl-2-C-methyl-D-erythritol kinase